MGKNIEQYSTTSYLNSTSKIVFGTSILYIFFAKLTKLIFISEINLLPLFPAMGFSVAATIIFGRKAIFGAVVGSLLFSLDLYKQEIFCPKNHQVFINSLSICLSRPLITIITTLIVSHCTVLWCKTKYPFNKGMHILNFSIASLLGSIVGPTIGIAFVSLFSNFSTENLHLFWSNLIRGNALGIILITPLVLSWLYKTEKKTQWTILKKLEAIVIPFATLVVSIYVFKTSSHNESVLYLLLIWAGYRFNVKLITMLTLIISIVSMYYTGHKMGGFGLSSWDNNFFLLQLFLFVNMVSILFFKAILIEKEAEENKLKISEQVLNTERNILKATIESTSTTSIFSLDTNLNYLNFNSPHEKFMKETHGASIKNGDNHLELITFEDKKEEFFSIFQSVLNGNIYEKEEKDIEGDFWKISKFPIKDNSENIIGISVIITNISDLKLKEIQLKENNLSLNERIKELSCLYDITKILNQKSISNQEKLQNCAQIIPASFQFPEKTNCRIQFREEEFFSDNYKKPNTLISQKIIIKGVECGYIEAGYFDEKKLGTEDVFLKEENKLLETLSDIISKSLQTRIAEENLKISEEKFRSIYENMQDIYYLHTLDGEIFEISPSVEKHLKYKREEVIGLNTKNLHYDLSKQKKLKEKLIKNGLLNDEQIQFISATGEPIFFSINCKIIYDKEGVPSHIEGSIRNINERILNQKQLLEANEKIKESEVKFRSIYESFDDIYFKTKVDGTIQELSPSFEKYFLQHPTQIIGGSILDLYCDINDRSILLEKLRTEDYISDFDAQFKDADGNAHFFSINAHFVYEDGIPAYIEGTLRNINDRIAVQKEMLSKNRKLEFQNTELEQFAYIASHDLQEPLITVIHSIQMLKEEFGDNLDEDQKHYLNFIGNSTSRMQLLVKGLLEYSRIGKERKSEKIDCNQIVCDVLADMETSLKESNAIVEYKNLPIIKGNTTEMRQLFQNLISNANKFRKKNIQPIIKISAVEENNNWLFSIKDNGIGIKEHDINKVFVIFKRLHNRDEYQGTGIGLSHCKKIIEQHKGKIWVESKQNEGSTFRWTIPIEQSL